MLDSRIALHATRAAVEEGGRDGRWCTAGTCLAHPGETEGGQRRPALLEIVRKAVRNPLRQIAENAGEDGAVIAGKIPDRDEYNWGF